MISIWFGKLRNEFASFVTRVMHIHVGYDSPALGVLYRCQQLADFCFWEVEQRYFPLFLLLSTPKTLDAISRQMEEDCES